MKPFHPALEAALRAVDETHRKRLCPDEAVRRSVRVEITHAVEDALMMHAYNNFDYRRFQQDGPMQFMGISFYVVARLPDPGWRVVSLLEPAPIRSDMPG